MIEKEKTFFQLHHVAIIVADLKQASHVYGDILGLELDERPEMKFEGLFYKLGGGQQLHIMQLNNPDEESIRPEHGGRYRHLALSISNLSLIKIRLDSENIPYTSSLSGRPAIFFYDADGNAIELVASDK